MTRYARHRHAHRIAVEESTRCPTPVYLQWMRPDPGASKTGPVLGITATPCKRWACEHCGRGKRAEALKLVRRVTEVGLQWNPRLMPRLITLTRPADKPNRLDDRVDCLNASEDVRELVKACRRSWSAPGRTHTLEYVRVFERTKRGRIHVHLLTWGHYVPKCHDAGRRAAGLPTGPGSGSPCYCPETRPCIQRLAWRHDWGWVDVRRVRSSAMAAAYVAKYLGKATGDDWPRHARRLSYSRAAAGGLTLGAVHAAWIAEVHRRLADPTHNAAGHVIDRVWLGIVPPPLDGPGPRAPPWGFPYAHYSPTTGERLPDPY